MTIGRFKEKIILAKNALKCSLLHLAYPKQCLHCQCLLDPLASLLCPSCASLLELIDPIERCLSCFEVLSFASTPICKTCKTNPPLYYRMAAAFDYQEVAATIIKKFKYHQQPYLARGMAAFLVAQWQQLEWPFPDAIIPVPMPFTHWLQRGYNQSALLADEMGKLLQRPVWQVLQRQSGDYSQAALSLEQRRYLVKKRFKLKEKERLQDKCLLIVDDVMTSGSTLNCCAQTLSAAGPAHLYAMTFCRTLQQPMDQNRH